MLLVVFGDGSCLVEIRVELVIVSRTIQRGVFVRTYEVGVYSSILLKVETVQELTNFSLKDYYSGEVEGRQ